MVNCLLEKGAKYSYALSFLNQNNAYWEIIITNLRKIGAIPAANTTRGENVVWISWYVLMPLHLGKM